MTPPLFFFFFFFFFGCGGAGTGARGCHPAGRGAGGRPGSAASPTRHQRPVPGKPP
ncbi:hypothetical protein LT493_24320 [Streptomyces tricolor]|nr:hypothetical protein [Streptomyces tricolor]